MLLCHDLLAGSLGIRAKVVAVFKIFSRCFLCFNIYLELPIFYDVNQGTGRVLFEYDLVSYECNGSEDPLESLRLPWLKVSKKWNRLDEFDVAQVVPLRYFLKARVIGFFFECKQMNLRNCFDGGLPDLVYFVVLVKGELAEKVILCELLDDLASRGITDLLDESNH